MNVSLRFGCFGYGENVSDVSLVSLLWSYADKLLIYLSFFPLRLHVTTLQSETGRVPPCYSRKAKHPKQAKQGLASALTLQLNSSAFSDPAESNSGVAEKTYACLATGMIDWSSASEIPRRRSRPFNVAATSPPGSGSCLCRNPRRESTQRKLSKLNSFPSLVPRSKVIRLRFSKSARARLKPNDHFCDVRLLRSTEAASVADKC